MNQRKAIPANGTRFNPIAKVLLCPESVNQLPATSAWGGDEILSSTRDEISSTEKMIPATAAARGVLSWLPARKGPSPSALSLIGIPPASG